MLKYIKFILVLGMLFTGLTVEAQNNSSKFTDADIEALINKMSIEEKAGQMTQVTIDMILKEKSSTEIDEKKLRYAIKDMQVGSILNVKWHMANGNG